MTGFQIQATFLSEEEILSHLLIGLINGKGWYGIELLSLNI
jgi:hypothetical protein